MFLYRGEGENPGIDRAFGLHALYGILWVVFAFLQMVPIRKASLDLHRSFGYIASATFFLHMWAAINNLFFDDGRHTMGNREVELQGGAGNRGLGLVDLDSGHSTTCPVVPGQVRVWLNRLCSWV